MSVLQVTRRSRVCVVLRSLNPTPATAARDGRPDEPCCYRRLSVTCRRLLSRPDGASPLKVTCQMQPMFLSSRCLATVPPKLAEEGKLIYTGSLGKMIRGVKFFSYTSSGMSLCMMPHILKAGLGVQSLAVHAAFFSVIGVFTFITPVLLHLVTRGYVVRLYHNADTDAYTAVTYSFLLMEKKTVFHQTQVRIPGVSKMFTTFYADKMGLLVNPDLFHIPQDYNHLMGYDRPFTFDMDDLEGPDKS
ncbi:transmembrane protein 70, mitochondrial [Lampris incognitus]|uniref:transmembrane protein 70, mitochondrial n=1 Tax=Lampris incognitus TaxID=2546036 RepID=UPI0024B60F20|nr:transmembrane protein 70, mitochondrial [Lampris incognitus]